MRYLLDTNMFIALRTRGDRAVVRAAGRHRRELALSAIVAHELYFGAFNSARVDNNLARIAELDLPILAFDDDDARAAGQIRARLRRAGTSIGPYDVLIAGQALARGLTMVTANVGEFGRVNGLAIENWLAAS